MAVPFTWPKTAGFNFLPEGTEKQHDAGKWALYYNPLINFSFIVIDFPGHWKINHYVGRLRVAMASERMRWQPCCQD
jgi:hypothetical protein